MEEQEGQLDEKQEKLEEPRQRKDVLKEKPTEQKEGDLKEDQNEENKIVKRKADADKWLKNGLEKLLWLNYLIL